MNKISTKLVVSVIILLVFTLVAIGIPSYVSIISESDNVLTTQMNQRIHCAWDIAGRFYDYSDRGYVSEIEAKQSFAEYLISRIVGDSGYGFAIDGDGTVIIHPDESMIGKDLSSKEYVQEMIKNKNKVNMDNGTNLNNMYDMTEKVTYEENGRKKFAYYAYDEEWDMFIALGGSYDEFDGAQSKALTILIGVGALVLAISSGLAYYFSKKFTKPIEQVAGAMGEVEQGNLKVDEVNVKSNDEIGTLARGFNAMLENLKDLTSSIRGTAVNLDDSLEKAKRSVHETVNASEEVAEAVQEISTANHSLAEDIEGGTSSMKEVSDSLKETNKSSKRMIELTNDANNRIEKGARITLELSKSSDETRDYFKSVSNKVNLLEEQSDKISNVTEIIRSISEQTSLLSLNAAIESARAGEAGKGFAVVADEIRKLAQQSSEQTDAISQVIGRIQKEIQDIVENVDNTNQVMDKQTEVVGNTAETFKDIEGIMQEMIVNIESMSGKIMAIESNSDNTLSMIENISAISEETSANSTQVNSLTQQQLASIHTIGSSMEDLKALSMNLTELIKKFKM